MRPFFSVIIPTFNRWKPLARALESLASQTYRNFEVIVCDDGSTDETEAKISEVRSVENLIYLKIPHWGGPARPRNIAISRSRGDWLAFLDSDDWWSPNKLENVAPHTDRADLIYHSLDWPENPAQPKIIAGAVKSPVFADLLLNRPLIPNSSVCLRRSVFEAVGPITEERELIAAEDLDLWIRVSRQTDRFLRLPECLGTYGSAADSISTGLAGRAARLLKLSERYAGFLDARDSKLQRARTSYQIARIYHQLGREREALGLYLKGVSLRDLPMAVKACAGAALATCSLLRPVQP